jgi:hypothetical protein
MAKNNDQKHSYQELKRKSETNPFLKRYIAMGIKEGLFSDSANALVCMHDTMVDAAWPGFVLLYAQLSETYFGDADYVC